jgi:hypothetical protein
MRNLHPPGYWTEETISAEAIKFDTRNSFKSGCLSAWRAAHRLGVADKACSHMTRPGDRKHRYVYEIVCHSRKLAYIGLTMNPEARRRQHGRMSTRLIAAFGTNDLPFRVISDLLPVDRAASLERLGVWHYAEVMEYNVLNIATAGGSGGGFEIWTDEKIREVAANHTNRSEFQNAHKGAYFAAGQRGILNNVCGHMLLKKRLNGYWDDPGLLHAEARKYIHRSAFERGSPGAFKAAKRLGILETVCAHMPRLRRQRTSHSP